MINLEVKEENTRIKIFQISSDFHLKKERLLLSSSTVLSLLTSIQKFIALKIFSKFLLFKFYQ